MKHKRKKSIPQPSYPVPVLTDWDRKFMAYHEAGHAICSYYLPEREPLICITIDPSSEAFGMIRTKSRPHHNETEISFRSTIATFLAGRISEEMFLKSKTTSCIYDLASARQIATDMVIKFGMGETLGLTVLDNNEYLQISEIMKENICKDIQKILAESESQAREILEKHSRKVKAMVDILSTKGTLYEGDIMNFFYGDLS